jgi:hypothetical protein
VDPVLFLDIFVFASIVQPWNASDFGRNLADVEPFCFLAALPTFVVVDNFL